MTGNLRDEMTYHVLSSVQWWSDLPVENSPSPPVLPASATVLSSPLKMCHNNWGSQHRIFWYS